MVIESYTKRITRLKQRVGESDPQGLERLQIEALHWEKDYPLRYLLMNAAASRSAFKLIIYFLLYLT